ncbi:hypothetical protein [Paenibacillus sophorae]|uniref:hypothetical protein n=1 Tax=Paenibacillus sophorae TaxID=1333845 RepID=UPI001FE63574|nr:hypothetical protein [Paenibacillus sophorae]
MDELEDELFNRAAEELLIRSGGSTEIIIEARFPGSRLVGGRYHMATAKVYLYKEQLKEQCLELFGSLNRLREYVAVVCAHELGHAEDRELVSLSNRLDEEISHREHAEIALQIEENAWRYAESLLPDIDPEFMRTIIDESLYAYRRKLRTAIA